MTQALAFEPGIYFGMSDEAYHQIKALSNSGCKNLRVSTMDFYARSWLNPKQEENADAEDSEAKIMGRAYHARVLEGAKCFYERFVLTVDPRDYPDALRTVDDIKARLRAHQAAGRPCKLTGNKPELIAGLLAVEPDAQLWDAIVEAYEAEHKGKTFLEPEERDRIEFGAAMIEKKPDLAKTFTGGMPEVTVVWVCPDTDVLCKMRIDYLKPREICDLKSFANLQMRPVDDAIGREFANRRMAFQAAWYLDGATHIAKLVKDGLVFTEEGTAPPSTEYLQKLRAGHDKDFLFIFLQKGVAPVARGKRFSSKLGIFQIAKAKNDAAKQVFVECLAAYPPGTPWVDAVPTTDFTDEEIPVYATD